MFDFKKKEIDNIANPLKITKNSVMEFKVGKLEGTGLYRFKKLIEVNLGGKKYTRYLIYSNVDNTEYVFEAFQGAGEQIETFIYSLTDTIPFSEEFLDVAGQRFLTTPQDIEYQRCIMPDNEDWIDGVSGEIKIYDFETDKVEKTVGVKLWEYAREEDGRTEFLNVEMLEDSGMFRIFEGEIIEDIFYKIYQTS